MKFLFSLITCGLIAGAVNAAFPPCNICADGGAVGNPDTVIPQDFGNVLVQDTTCAEVQQMGADGAFNIIQCALLEQAGISDSCGCGEVPTPVTPAPITSPTAPPVAPVVPAPMPANPPTAPPDEATVAPTVAPTPAATGPPVDGSLPPASNATTVAGSVYIRLIPVGDDPFETPEEDAFESACSSLYGDGLADILANVSCTLRLFTLTPVDDIGNSLNVVTQVAGTPIGDNVSSTNLSELLPSTFNENAADFVTLLQTEGSEESLAYFGNVTYAEAFNPDGEIPPPSVPVPVPVPAPTQAPIGAAPTAKPMGSASPTAGAFEGSGSVYLRISPVGPEELPAAAEAAFEEACSAFYTEYLEGVLENATCTLRLSTLVSDVEGDTSDATVVNTLGVITDVGGTPVGNTTLEEFEDLLVSIMTENSDDFITTLQLSGNEGAQAFFANVTDVSAYDIAPTAAPVAPPTGADAAPVAPPTGADDDDDGLSGGAIAGIVVAGIVAVIGVILLAQNCGGESSESLDAVTPISSSVTYRQSTAPLVKVKSEPLLSTPVVSRSEPMSASVATAVALGSATVIVASEPIGGADRTVASRRRITAEGSVANVRSIKDPSIVVDPSVIAVASASSRSDPAVGFSHDPPADYNYEPSSDNGDSSSGDQVMM